MPSQCAHTEENYMRKHEIQRNSLSFQSQRIISVYNVGTIAHRGTRSAMKKLIYLEITVSPTFTFAPLIVTQQTYPYSLEVTDQLIDVTGVNLTQFSVSLFSPSNFALLAISMDFIDGQFIISFYFLA